MYIYIYIYCKLTATQNCKSCTSQLLSGLFSQTSPKGLTSTKGPRWGAESTRKPNGPCPVGASPKCLWLQAIKIDSHPPSSYGLPEPWSYHDTHQWDWWFMGGKHDQPELQWCDDLHSQKSILRARNIIARRSIYGFQPLQSVSGISTRFENLKFIMQSVLAKSKRFTKEWWLHYFGQTIC